MVLVHFLLCSCPVFPTPFIEETLPNPGVYFCLLWQIVVDHNGVGLSLGSLFCSTDLQEVIPLQIKQMEFIF